MLERICVPANEPERTTFDLGLLAESLIFYGEVHVVLSATSLDGLLRQLGPDLLLELVSQKYLHVHFIDHLLGAISADKDTPFALHDVAIVHAQGRNLDAVARDAFVAVTRKSGRGRRLATRFIQAIDSVADPEAITKSITEDMQDGSYLEAYIRRRLSRMNPTVDGRRLDQIEYKFSLVPGRGFQLQSNLDPAALRAAGVDVSDVEDPASVLAHYGATVADMTLWAQLVSEVAVTSQQEDVLTSRIDLVLEKRVASQEHLSTFQSFVFDDARAVREAINQGRRKFEEILPVLERCRRFREWLAGQPADVNLVKAYHREVIAESWVDRLPAKTSRWSLFTGGGIVVDMLGAGGLGTVGGVALSAFDSFLLDSLLKGWKPDQFVEGPLRRFVEDGKT